MGKSIDLTGQKFNKLLVLKDSGKRNSNKEKIWQCRCDCGNIKEVNTSNLKRGNTKSCGCLKKRRTSMLDYVGTKFNYLIALGPVLDKKGFWKFQCECGEIVEKRFNDVQQGKTKSCGCKSQRGQHNREMIGKKIGKLTLLEKLDEKASDNHHYLWKCQCECGNIVKKPSNELSRSNGSISCGCLTKSKGEFKISDILKRNAINFETEKIFKNCKFQDTNAYARFDFFVNNTYIIEYDGEQHFKAVSHFGGDEYFTSIRNNDAYKNQWCKKNNIPLIRIPYTHYDKICLEDLLLETSTFKI